MKRVNGNQHRPAAKHLRPRLPLAVVRPGRSPDCSPDRSFPRPYGGPQGTPPDDGRTGDVATNLATRTVTRTRKPSLYKVLLLNDDYTPMEFVVHVLQRFFRMGLEDATRVMLHVHQRGVGVCGVFTYEVAETKVSQVMDFARQHQHPLQCTLEKA